MNHRRVLICMALTLAVGPASSTAFADEDREASRLINDCGVNSLYLLLKLRSAEADLAELRRALPETEAHGLSMAEIQAASRRHGVPLRGRQVGAGDLPFDRPMIVLFKLNSGQGHFVVLEPVGVTGKKVMLLDFPRPPEVVDYTDLLKGAAWTGLALAPVSAWARAGPWLAGGSGLILITIGLFLPWRRRKGLGRIPGGALTDAGRDL